MNGRKHKEEKKKGKILESVRRRFSLEGGKQEELLRREGNQVQKFELG